MTAIVFHRGHKPQHEGEFEEKKGGGEIELVQEQLREEERGEKQPVAEEGESAGGASLGLLQGLVCRHQEAEHHLQQQVRLRHHRLGQAHLWRTLHQQYYRAALDKVEPRHKVKSFSWSDHSISAGPGQIWVCELIFINTTDWALSGWDWTGLTIISSLNKTTKMDCSGANNTNNHNCRLSDFLLWLSAPGQLSNIIWTLGLPIVRLIFDISRNINVFISKNIQAKPD